MSREVIFRGKSEVTNEWVYGSLVKVGNESHIVGFDEVDLDGHHLSYCSDRPIFTKQGTIGQFTGLHDKNGKEIYEGDIVQLDYITTSGKHRIGLSFEVKWCTQEGCWVGWDGFVENTLQQTRKMFVVKGNIHDNPELLKGEAE